GKRGVWIAETREVGRARPRAELGEQVVAALLGLCSRDAAFRIVDVSEHDRLGRADLLAGREDLAVSDRTVLLFRFDPRAIDALNAVGALLHDAAAADGDVGIARKLQALDLEILVEIEVESAHLVGAVVRAVPGADAPVVDHFIQAFGAVDGRADG